MKTATWMSILLSGTIVAALSGAYMAGIKTSASAHASVVTNERIDDVSDDVSDIEEDFAKHVEVQAVETKKVNSHLHQIDLKMQEQTTILKRIERKDE